MKTNKIFLAIIIGALIIGTGIYFGLKNNNQKSEVLVASKLSQTNSAQNPAVKIKNNSVPVAQNPASSVTCGASNSTIVTKVIDGDTVVVEGGWHVRLLGMDADEKGYPCYDPAKTRLEDLVLSKQVVLEKDISDVDQYGRCLRYIFVGTANIDTQLVKEGLAVARFYQPDVKYRSEITSAEQQAQASSIGCKWSKLSQLTQ